MSKCKKYSSFLTEQKTFDNWRDYLKEGEEPRREVRETKERVLRLSSQEINYLKENNIPVPPHIINEDDDTASDVMADVGVSLLASMLGSEEGRNKMADMLVAMPNWMQENLCTVPESLVSGTEKLAMGEPGDPDAPSALGIGAGIMKKLCGWGTKLSYSPLYMIAYVLRTIPDSADESFEDLERLKELPVDPSLAPTVKMKRGP